MMLIGKTWMMEEEWTKVCTRRSIRILFSSFSELCYFRQRRGLISVVNLYKKKVSSMHAQAFHSCEVRKYFTHPSSLVKSSSNCFFSIYLLFSARFVLWVHLVDSGWFLNQWSQNKLQNITQSRRRTNKESQPWILLLCPVSLELFFFFNVFLVLTETPWRKLNSAPVCFGAKDNQFGRFQVEVDGSIQAVKLVHLSGQVTCDPHPISWSNWGCD